jgi:hypothetical protein
VRARQESGRVDRWWVRRRGSSPCGRFLRAQRWFSGNGYGAGDGCRTLCLTVVGHVVQVPHRRRRGDRDVSGAGDAVPRGPWSAAEIQSGAAGVVGCDWRPTQPPSARIPGPLVWRRWAWRNQAALRSGVGVGRAAEMALRYLLLTYSYGINYRKNRFMSRLL